MPIFISILILYFAQAEVVNSDKGKAIFDKEGDPINECNADDQTNSDIVAWEILKNAKGENDQWKSVGQINGLGSVCTTTLVIPPQCNKSIEELDNMPAQVITNGHCTGTKRSSPHVLFNYFMDVDESNHIKVDINKTLYSSMKTFDLGILQLGMTYKELKEKGIMPRKISTSVSKGRLTNIGVPVNNIDDNKAYIRQSYCDASYPVTLVEGDYVWANQRASKCSVKGGSSGSALFNEQGEVSALLNTGVMNDCVNAQACIFNRPCEVKDGNINKELMNYGFDTNILHNCYKNCQFDASLPACPLPENTQLIEGKPKESINSFKQKITLNSNFTNYKLKLCKTGDSQCRCSEPTDYKEIGGTSFSLNKLGEFELNKTYDEHYTICAIGFKNGQWQNIKDASALPMRLDQVPPDFTVETKPIPGRGLGIYPTPPVKWLYQVAPSDSPMCQSVPNSNYYPAEPQRWGALLLDRRTNLNKKYICVMAMDKAGNKTYKSLLKPNR